MPRPLSLASLVAAAVMLVGASHALAVVAPSSTTPPSIPAPRAYLANTATAGTWAGDTPTVTDQWEVSSDQSTWSNATGAGATTLTYTPVQADAGRYLRLKQTATNGAGNAVAYSAVQYVTRPDVLFTRNSAATGTNHFTAFPILPQTSAMLAGIAAGVSGNSSSFGPPVNAPTGQFVFAGTTTGTVARLPMNADGTFGTPTTAATCSGNVSWGLITRDSRYAYFVDRSNNLVCQYAYEAATGTLTALSPSTASVGCGNISTILESPVRAMVYVSCRDGGLAAFAIGNGGALTALQGSPFETSIRPTRIAITPDGKNIYATQYDSGQWVRGFSVDPGTGAPSYQAGISFTSSGVDGVAALSNSVVYVGNYNNATITRYQRDANTGALSGADTVSTSAGGGPNPPAAMLLPSPDGTVLYFGASSSQSVMGQMGIGTGGVLSALNPYTRATSAAEVYYCAYSRPTPHVAVFSTPSTSITSPAVSTLTYTLNFGEPATGMSADDFIVGGTSAGWAVQSVSGQGAGPYTVTLAGGTTDGTVALSVKANVATGVNGITGPAGDVAAPVVTLNRPPMAAWTTVPSTPVVYASSSPLTYVATFNKAVTGVSSSVFTNTGTATGCSINTPTTAGQSVTSALVTVTGCSPGTVVLTLAQNSLTDAAQATGPAAADAASPVTIESPAPTTASWTSVPSSRVPFEDASSLTYLLTFGDPVTGLTAASFSNLGTATGCTIAVDAPASQAVTSVTVTVSGCTPGTVLLRMAAGAATGPFGVVAPASAITAPMVTVQSPSGDSGSSGVASPGITFGTPTVSGAGIVSLPLTCTGPAGPCNATASLIVGGRTVATGPSTGSVGIRQWARLALPAAQQRQLARTGRLVVTMRASAVIGGREVTADKRVTLRAPQGVRAVDVRARVLGSGLAARVHARCVGGPAARCDTKWRLVVVRVLEWSAADEQAVAGTGPFVAASGRSQDSVVSLDANGRAMVALCRRVLVRAEVTVGTVTTRSSPFIMGNTAACGRAAVTG